MKYLVSFLARAAFSGVVCCIIVSEDLGRWSKALLKVPAGLHYPLFLSVGTGAVLLEGN
jgi:hypothetical protein